jgi:hypothetical protein
MPQSKGPFGRRWRWVKDQIVGPVPKDIVLCEFSCRKNQCTMGEWGTCERRLKGVAGELGPAPSDARGEQPKTGSNGP